VTVKRQTEFGYDVIEAPLPAVVAVSDAINEPRYPSLKGIMAARSKQLTTVALADVDGAEAGTPTTAVLGAEAPPPRAATRVIREPAEEAGRQVVAFLVERRII
jgi:electron transfer flavoprotein beta subunit